MIYIIDWMSDESRHDSDENVYNINEICNNLLMGGSMIVPIITYLCILLISILSVVSIGSILTVVGIEFGKNDLLIKDTNKYKLLKYLKNDYDTIIKLNIFLINIIVSCYILLLSIYIFILMTLAAFYSIAGIGLRIKLDKANYDFGKIVNKNAIGGFMFTLILYGFHSFYFKGILLSSLEETQKSIDDCEKVIIDKVKKDDIIVENSFLDLFQDKTDVSQNIILEYCKTVQDDKKKQNYLLLYKLYSHVYNQIPANNPDKNLIKKYFFGDKTEKNNQTYDSNGALLYPYVSFFSNESGIIQIPLWDEQDESCIQVNKDIRAINLEFSKVYIKDNSALMIVYCILFAFFAVVSLFFFGKIMHDDPSIGIIINQIETFRNNMFGSKE